IVHPLKTQTSFFILVYSIVHFFFFSSRRRHTISLRDWSSDVCSSDLKDSSAVANGIIQGGDPLMKNPKTPKNLWGTGGLNLLAEIGRASCRERVKGSGVEGAVKGKM